ncbi:bifunctional adenosylcobinamide kinase/adenosylcobinamide-phosphate guanylyltransferase [Sphingomonas sp.]|uniref:bifunctional adenosylcobinamide kinase/adenosylcobinamide-phosphate guanylyltransferase n=1 Tax=Sphingomonas sp. TaxID=28214 RepID=UPI002ED86133
MNTLLVLGGARSGKSRYAQTRAEALDGELVFVATGQALDAEMADRIARHRADRGPRWITVEAPIELAAAVRSESREDRVLLIDCLTLWTTNLLLAERDIPAAAEALIAAIADAAGPLILVANEVGLGIVPDNPLARRFRDEAGRVNQQVAAAVDGVVFVAAGLPLKLK